MQWRHLILNINPFPYVRNIIDHKTSAINQYHDEGDEMVIDTRYYVNEVINPCIPSVMEINTKW